MAKAGSGPTGTPFGQGETERFLLLDSPTGMSARCAKAGHSRTAAIVVGVRLPRGRRSRRWLARHLQSLDVSGLLPEAAGDGDEVVDTGAALRVLVLLGARLGGAPASRAGARRGGAAAGPRAVGPAGSGHCPVTR